MNSSSGTLETIEVRTSPAEVIVPLVLMGVLLAGIAASVDYLGPRQRLIAFAGFAAPLVAVAAARLVYRGPRLVISPAQLSWRGSRRGSLQRLAWSDIQSARIEPAMRRTPPRLRLILVSSAVLETISSGELHRHVDIPIDGIDLSWGSLKLFIHRAAPHLFPPSA